MRINRSAWLAAALLPAVSYAALGGAPGTGAPAPGVVHVTPQQSAAPASLSNALPASLLATGALPAVTAPYSTHLSTDANGVTIREYATSGNVVFAVTWEGPIRPDMTELLGSYFPNFVAAGASRPHGTGPLIEGNDDFRIESAGRLGHFFGIAYLPRLLPANVRPGDLP